MKWEELLKQTKKTRVAAEAKSIVAEWKTLLRKSEYCVDNDIGPHRSKLRDTTKVSMVTRLVTRYETAHQ